MESSSQFHLMLFLESSVIGRISFHFVFSAISEWASGVPVSMQGLPLGGIYKLQPTKCNFTQRYNNTPFTAQE